MTGERLCKQCLRWLPEEAFQKGALNPNGKPYVRHVCKACDNFRRACKRSSGPKPVAAQRRVCKTCGVAAAGPRRLNARRRGMCAALSN